jgi:hypothetical protein
MSRLLAAWHCNRTLKLSAGSAQSVLKREIQKDGRTGLPPDSDRWSTGLQITRSTATLKLNAAPTAHDVTVSQSNQLLTHYKVTTNDTQCPATCFGRPDLPSSGVAVSHTGPIGRRCLC